MMQQCKILAIIFTFLLAVMSFAGCAGTDIKSQVIAFPDKNPKTIIGNTLDKPSDEEILPTDPAKLKKLNIQNSNTFDNRIFCKITENGYFLRLPPLA